jgi:hypothetical protein
MLISSALYITSACAAAQYNQFYPLLLTRHITHHNNQVSQSDKGEPEVQVMIKQQQDQLRQEYEGKLANLEREREGIGG